MGIGEATLYVWPKKFAGVGRPGLRPLELVADTFMLLDLAFQAWSLNWLKLCFRRSSLIGSQASSPHKKPMICSSAHRFFIGSIFVSG